MICLDRIRRILPVNMSDGNGRIIFRKHGKRRSRIVFVHSSNEMYGSDRILLQVIRSVPEDRLGDVLVWLPNDVPPGVRRLDDELQKLGVGVLVRSLPILRRQHFSLRGILVLGYRSAALVPALLRERPEVVYCSTSAGLLAAPISKICGVPKVALHVQEIWSGVESRVLRMLAHFVDNAIAISSAVAGSVGSATLARTEVIPNGVDGPQVKSVPTDSRTTGPIRFVMAGRWNSWKGHATLLAAWNSDSPPGELMILGGPPPSGSSVDVPDLVRRLKHPSSVTVVGEVPDIGPLIDAGDVMIVPSDAPEPFGLVAIEGFSRGLPVVASKDGGLVDIVDNGRNGWHFERKNVDQLRTVLQSLTLSIIGKAGMEAREDFSRLYSSQVFRGRLSTWWQDQLKD